MTVIIDNCIQWNSDRLKQAKTPAEARRYEENIKNLEALRETDNDQTQPSSEGIGG